jgi:hypothetical protein
MRLGMLLLALLIAAGAQVMLQASPPQAIGWILYVVAVVLFVSQAKQQPLPQVAGGRLGEAVSVSMPRHPRMFWALITSALLFSLLALIAFPQPHSEGWGWTFYLLGALLFLVAFLPLGYIEAWLHLPSRVAREKRLPTNDKQRPISLSPSVLHVRSFDKRLLLLATLLLAALIVRVWQAESLPEGVFFDEARLGLVARHILADPTYRPLYESLIERPAHQAYLTAIAFAMFGIDAASLRLQSEIFGVLNVLTAYLLFGRLLRSEARAGLVAAALLAVMRWDITFSRLALDGSSTPFFIMLVLFFLDRGLERKQLSDFAFAGLALGFGLAFYLPVRVFAVLVFILSIGMAAAGVCLPLSAWSSAGERYRSLVRPYVPHLFFFALGTIIAIGPVVEFAIQSPNIFFDRTNSASVFYETGQAHLLGAIWDNTLKHLSMFNSQGDLNGRHNLPGAPMLNSAMAILAIFGLGLAARQWRNLANLVMLAIFGAMLLSGILSNSSSAPHALRSIGVLTPLIYFMTLALTTIARELERVIERIRWPRTAWSGRTMTNLTLAVFLAWVGEANLDFYFNIQMNDAEVWANHSTAETWVAYEINRLGPAYDFLVSLHYWKMPTLEFLAPDAKNMKRWSLDDHLPLSQDANRPVVMFLDPTLGDFLDDVHRLYPNAPIQELTPPGGGTPIAYEVMLSIEAIRTAPHQ